MLCVRCADWLLYRSVPYCIGFGFPFGLCYMFMPYTYVQIAYIYALVCYAVDSLHIYAVPLHPASPNPAQCLRVFCFFPNAIGGVGHHSEENYVMWICGKTDIGYLLMACSFLGWLLSASISTFQPPRLECGFCCHWVETWVEFGFGLEFEVNFLINVEYRVEGWKSK